MKNIDDILRAIPTLSRLELDQVRQRVQAAISVQPFVGTDDSSPSSDTMLMNDCIQQVMIHMGHGPVYYRVALTTEQKSIMQWAEVHTSTKVELRTLLTMGFQLIAEELQRMKLTVTPGMIVKNTLRMPMLMENAFPGYQAAGMLKWVVGQRTGDHATNKAKASETTRGTKA